MTRVTGMLLASRILNNYRAGYHGNRYPES